MRRALLVCLLLAAACKRGGQQTGQQGEGVPVTVAHVEKKTVPQQITAIGTVEPTERFDDGYERRLDSALIG